LVLVLDKQVLNPSLTPGTSFSFRLTGLVLRKLLRVKSDPAKCLSKTKILAQDFYSRNMLTKQQTAEHRTGPIILHNLRTT